MSLSKLYKFAVPGLLLLLVVVGHAQDKPELTTAKLMEKKLHLSQAILAGIVKEDYAGISTNADRLLQLAKVEWIQKDTPEYREHLKDFWIVLEGLKSAAADKNADGTTLAYVQMTLSCVKCHKYLRTPVN